MTRGARFNLGYRLAAQVLAAALLLAGCATSNTVSAHDNQVTPAGVGNAEDYALQGQQERDRVSLMMVLAASRFH